MTQFDLLFNLRATERQGRITQFEEVKFQAAMGNAPMGAIRKFVEGLQDLIRATGAPVPAHVQSFIDKFRGNTVIEAVPVKPALPAPKKERAMGEASDLVGKHDHLPAPTPSKDPILSDLTVILDKLDRAIQAKEKDLAKEKGQEPENHGKLGVLKAADALVRQARGLLTDYHDMKNIGDTDTEEDEETDPYSWIKEGILVKDEDDNEFEVHAFDVAAELVTIHPVGLEKFQQTLHLDDFIGSYEFMEDADA